MSDSRDPKRIRLTDTPPILDDDLPFDDDEVSKAVAWGESFITHRHPPKVYPLCGTCSSHICAVCTNHLHEMERRQESHSELQMLNKNVDTELLQSLTPSKRRSHKTPVKQFRMRLTSDKQDAVGTVASVPSINIPIPPNSKPPATQSQMGYNELLNLFRRTLSLTSTAPLSESHLRSITLEELEKCPKFQKVSILSRTFEQSTSSLEDMLKKGSKDTNARRSLYSRLPSVSTQINTLESYSKMTLLYACENQAQYLFRDDIAKRVVSIVSTLTKICVNVPEARDLMFPEVEPDSYDIIPKRKDIGPVTPSINGLSVGKELRELRKGSTDVDIHVSTLLLNCEIFTPKHFQTLATRFVSQIVEVLLHRQMNREVVIACLNFLATLNIYNPGNYLDCLHRVLLDNQLNVLFELDNLDHKVVHGVVRFYNTLPLTPLFTHFFTNELFHRFIYFVCHYQKPDLLLLSIKSDILYFLAKTVHMHKVSLTRASVDHVSDLSQKFLRSNRHFTRADHDEILLQVRLLYFFLSRDYPKQFRYLKKKPVRIAEIEKISGIKSVFRKLRVTFDLLHSDLLDLQLHPSHSLISSSSVDHHPF